MDRDERSTGHAVLQAGPRGLPKRLRSGRQPLVERLDVPSIREDLRPRELKPPRRHVQRRFTNPKASVSVRDVTSPQTDCPHGRPTGF
jgi:hypothetical protein